jgi:glycosyltransferase involved in cell wall biosynthesis
MAVQPIKVEVISPCMTFTADAPYSTRMRAHAMCHAGLDVEVMAFPDTYPTHAGDLGVPYVGMKAVVGEDAYQRCLCHHRKWGAYWQFIGEPYRVMEAGCRRALERGCDLVYIADVEPWVTLPFCVSQAMKRFPLPLTGQVPGQYMGFMKASFLRTKIRFGLNYYAVRFLPRFMDIMTTTRQVLETLKIGGHPRSHVLPEGHETLLGAYLKEEARSHLGLPLDKRMILLFGVAGSGKGADILFHALETVPPEFVVCVVGKTGGVYEASWGDVSRLREVGWTEDRLRIVDRFVTEEEMQAYYAACDAVVIPYRWPFAGTSTHLRRASEHGKAIIACDQYHIGERVKKYDLGLVFTTGDAKSLAHQLRSFMSMPPCWFDNIMIKSLQLRTAESWENVGIKYHELFRSIVKQNINKPQLCS